MSNNNRKVALITGANKGIGFEIARQLGKAGMTVLVAARNVEMGESAAARLRDQKVDARFLELDLTQFDTINAAAAKIESEFGRLDVLVNNAGIIDKADGLPGQADPNAVRRVFETNFFGTFAVTRAMLPLLRKSPAGRIVNLSSGLASLTLNADPKWEFADVKLLGYNASKAALNMMTIHLAHELRDTPIKVNAADPGYTATDMNDNQGTQTLEEGAAEAVRLAQLPPDGPSGGYSSSSGPLPW